MNWRRPNADKRGKNLALIFCVSIIHAP